MTVHPSNPKYIPKPYEQMEHPVQRIQVNVNLVREASKSINIKQLRIATNKEIHSKENVFAIAKHYFSR